MAHLDFENKSHSILNQDRPTSWSYTSAMNSLTAGRGRKQTPSRIGGDRYIPTRNSEQMEIASFLLTRKKEPMGPNTLMTPERKKAWSVALNGYDIEDARVLHFGERPKNLSQGFQNNQVATLSSIKKTRCISSNPDGVLGAPGLRNDFYLNLLDWSNQNVLAVALNDSVYLWDATHGCSTRLMKMKREDNYICSLSWAKEGNCLAVGTSDCKVQLWDVMNQKSLLSMASHTARVGSLSWNEHVLSSGSRSGQIHHHDLRLANPHIFTLHTGHSQEVCGLKWSPNGRFLASGGDDNLVFVWPSVSGGGGRNGRRPVHSWSDHQGAVKALAWCPWRSGILATGGGTSDCHIRVWNINCGSCITSLDTQSQISSLVYASNYKELVSSHGYAHNNVVIWKCPSMTKVAELSGHKDRVLNLALSPDCSTVASIAADETVHLWRSFDVDPVKDKERLGRSASSLLFPTLR